MPLDTHQRHHVEALLKDSADRTDVHYRTAAERNRVSQLAQDMLDGIDDWPHPRLPPVEIHDSIEKLDLRSFWDAELAMR